MGNGLTSSSCGCAASIMISACNGGGSSCGVVKVLSSEGRLEEVYRRGVKAGEVMVEKGGGHFLCNSGDLKVGQRIPGVSADQELQVGQLYFLLPMEMLYSVLTHEEITSLLTHHINASISNSKRGIETSSSSSNKISPPPAQGFTSTHHPVQRQRSWIPALETISET